MWKIQKTSGAVKLAAVLAIGLAIGLTLNAAGPTLLEAYSWVGLRVACDRCGSMHLNSFDSDGIREPLCQQCRVSQAKEDRRLATEKRSRSWD